VTEGVKKTDTVQLLCAANVFGERGQLVVSVKSGRLFVIVLIVKLFDWLFVTVTLEAALFCPTT